MSEPISPENGDEKFVSFNDYDANFEPVYQYQAEYEFTEGAWQLNELRDFIYENGEINGTEILEDGRIIEWTNGERNERVDTSKLTALTTEQINTALTYPEDRSDGIFDVEFEGGSLSLGDFFDFGGETGFIDARLSGEENIAILYDHAGVRLGEIETSEENWVLKLRM